MTPSKKIRTLLAALIASGCMLSIGSAEPVSVDQKLDEIVVPRVEMVKAPLSDALEFLRIGSGDLDKISPKESTLKGLNFILKDPKGKLAEARVTMTLNQIPVRSVLDYIVRMTGTSYRIDDHAVVIGLEEDLAEGNGTYFSSVPVGRTREIYDALLNKRLPAVSIENATIGDAIEFFRKASEGLEAKDSKASGLNFVVKNPGKELPKITLHMKDVPLGVALGYACELSGLAYTIHPSAILIGTREDLQPKPLDPGEHAYGRSGVLAGGMPLAKRLKSIMVDKVELREATIDEALDLIRSSATAAQKAEGETHPKGINLINLAQDNEERYSLSLRNIPAWELLEYVTTLTYTEFRVEKVAVVVDWKLPRRTKEQAPEVQPIELPEVPEVDPTKVFELRGGDPGDLFIPDPGVAPLIIRKPRGKKRYGASRIRDWM